MEELIKISFVGDVMCEKPLLKASYKNGSYDFKDVFKHIESDFKSSDYVIANLETVFAGKEKGYSNDIYSFNTPDEFLEAVRDSGVSHVSLANNHCLDRGIDGLVRTMDLLEENNIKYFGTKRNREEKDYEVIENGGYKIALLNYTYGTNVDENRVVFDESNDFHVNVLRSQDRDLDLFLKSTQVPSFRAKLSKIIRKFTNLEMRMKLKKAMGKLKLKPSTEVFSQDDLYYPYINRMKEDIKKARKECDFVILCLHSGSIFNTEIGAYTEKVIEIIKAEGVDAIVGHHSHIVKGTENLDNTFIAYSLGNFSLSPSGIYVLHDELPDYGIMLNFYFSKEALEKKTFAIIKMIERSDGKLSVFPISQLRESLSGLELEKLYQDSRKIYCKVLNLEIDKMQDFEIEDEFEII